MTIQTERADECGTDKGTHQGFMPIYDRYLPNKYDRISLVELGVYRGASIYLWDTYFENQYSKIYGVDIDLSQLADRYTFSNRVSLIQGDQADWYIPSDIFTAGGLQDLHDVIIDDASHISSKTIDSFASWWAYLKPGGLYIVEDTHCSYDTDFYGDESAPPRGLNGFGEYHAPTTMEFLKRLADDVNWNYHGYNRFEPLYKNIAFVHFYPGIAVIGKK